jgi:hypothetical protein
VGVPGGESWVEPHLGQQLPGPAGGLPAGEYPVGEQRGITGLLDIDLDDPDQRLALQLACRARLLD